MGLPVRPLLVLAAVTTGGLVGAGIAAADPTVSDPTLPATDPAPVQIVDPVLPVTDPFAAASQLSKADPAGALAGLLTGNGGGSPAAALGQAMGFSAPPGSNPLANVSSLMAHNFRMPTEDTVSPYVLQTDVPAGPFARVDAFKGLHAMLHGSLGRMPGAELGQPLPGTAPPPGTAIPAGIEQFLPPPEVPVPPAGDPAVILPGG